MKKPAVPSPVKHPNAYAGFSVAAATTLLIAEAARFGVAITVMEAGFIVGGVIYLTLLLAKRVKPSGSDQSDV